MDLSVRVILSLLIVLVALALGFFIRSALVKRFTKGGLGYQLARAAGVSIILLLLLLAAVLSLVIITEDATLFALLLGTLSTQPTLFQSAVSVIWYLALTGTICALGLLSAEYLKTTLSRRLQEQEVEANLRALAGRASYALVLVLVFLAVLMIWDVQIALPITIIVGVLTFALRDLIRDLIAGIYILLERQFQIGDQITISSFEGTVTHIDMRATSLRLVTGEAMVVPNGRFLDQSVRNNTRYKDRRATIMAIFAQEDYDEHTTPLQLVRAIKNTTIVSQEGEPTIIMNAVKGRVEGFHAEEGGYSNKTVTLAVSFWVESRNRVAVTSVMEALKYAFPHTDFVVQQFAASV
jgi:small conductance mechanosensitive channel